MSTDYIWTSERKFIQILSLIFLSNEYVKLLGKIELACDDVIFTLRMYKSTGAELPVELHVFYKALD